MAIGSFMGKTFKVSNKKILTPSNFNGSSGADYATHDRAGKKARSQFLGAKLREYEFDIILEVQNGVSPLKIKEYFQKKCEKGNADYFVVGGKPLSKNRFVITSISEEWGSVIRGGTLTQCNLSLTIQEYL